MVVTSHTQPSLHTSCQDSHRTWWDIYSTSCLTYPTSHCSFMEMSVSPQKESDAHCLGISMGRCWGRMGRSPPVWQLSLPSPFYTPPSPRRGFSNRVKTLSNCLSRSCSLLRVRQKGQRGPERDDEGGRDEGWEGWRKGCQPSWVTLPSEASWPNISGAWQRQMWCGEVAIKEQTHTQLKCHPLELLAQVYQADGK